MNANNDNKVNCFQCIYFTVTWDTQFPRACSLYGFKSANLPSATVLETTGTACLGFVKKGSKEKA